MPAWVTDFAPTTAELNRCVACGLCLPHCPTFRLTGLEAASPRGRIAAMRAVGEGVLAVDGDFEEAMTFCLNCRACEAVCPSMAPFGRMMEGARAEIAVQRPSFRRRLRHLVLGRLLPSRGALGLVTEATRVLQRTGVARLIPGRFGRGLRGMRRLQPGHLVAASASEGERIGFLAGCVMSKWFPEVNRVAVDLLTRGGYQVVIPAGQTCCGALAVHDGDVEDGRRLAVQNRSAFSDFERIVATAAGCSAHLKGLNHLGAPDLADKSSDITEVIAELIAAGRLPSLPANGDRVSLHQPCHLRHAQKLIQPPRLILEAAGYEVVDPDPDGICCGAAGIYSLLRPETSRQLGERIAGLIATEHQVATSNPGCEMQLRVYLDQGRSISHPLELYAQAIASVS